jgi:hypothetical protein
LTTLSTALGMETCKAHARRRTVTVARFENCGVDMVYPLIMMYPPIAKDRGTGRKNAQTPNKNPPSGGGALYINPPEALPREPVSGFLGVGFFPHNFRAKTRPPPGCGTSNT